jgi:hypothetical protein
MQLEQAQLPDTDEQLHAIPTSATPSFYLGRKNAASSVNGHSAAAAAADVMALATAVAAREDAATAAEEAAEGPPQSKRPKKQHYQGGALAQGEVSRQSLTQQWRQVPDTTPIGDLIMPAAVADNDAFELEELRCMIAEMTADTLDSQIEIPAEVQLQHEAAVVSAVQEPLNPTALRPTALSPTALSQSPSVRPLAVLGNLTDGCRIDGCTEPADADQAVIGLDMIDDSLQQQQQQQHEEVDVLQQQQHCVGWLQGLEQLQQPARAKERQSEEVIDLALQPGKSGRLHLLIDSLAESGDADKAAAVTSSQWQAIDPAELGVVLGPPPVVLDEPAVLLPTTAAGHHPSGDLTFF